MSARSDAGCSGGADFGAAARARFGAAARARFGAVAKSRANADLRFNALHLRVNLHLSANLGYPDERAQPSAQRTLQSATTSLPARPSTKPSLAASTDTANSTAYTHSKAMIGTVHPPLKECRAPIPIGPAAARM